MGVSSVCDAHWMLVGVREGEEQRARAPLEIWLLRDDTRKKRLRYFQPAARHPIRGQLRALKNRFCTCEPAESRFISYYTVPLSHPGKEQQLKR